MYTKGHLGVPRTLRVSIVAGVTPRTRPLRYCLSGASRTQQEAHGGNNVLVSSHVLNPLATCRESCPVLFTFFSPFNRPHVLTLSQVFLRASLLLMVADSPQRALMLGCKHPNSSTRHPCTLCLVEQSGDDGGQLGDPRIDVKSSRLRRTRQTMETSWSSLEEMRVAGESTRDIEARSMELGVVPPKADGMPQPLFETITLGNPVVHVPPERLHADALVRPNPMVTTSNKKWRYLARFADLYFSHLL